MTDQEYEAAIVALHGRAPESLSKFAERELRKKEFALMIDHRLGSEFPQELRDELWRIQERIERKRLAFAARSLLHKLSMNARAQTAGSLADLLVDEYAKVIGQADAQRFFGLEPGERPYLSTDVER